MNFGMPLVISMIAGAVAAMLVAAVIGYFTLGLKGDYFCIATLGFGESMRLIFDNIDYFGERGDFPAYLWKRILQ